MTRDKLITFLRQPGFISAQKAEEIAGRFLEKEIAKGDLFLKAGQLSNEYLFLDSGYMRAFAIDPEGNEVTTAFYSPNNVVFEVSSFFTRSASMENIQALSDCSGWYINFNTLNDLFHGLPEFREFGRNILVQGFTALKARTLYMITESAEERYLRLLNKNPEVFQQAPLKCIASYLGITDTSLSRIRKELSKG